MATTLQRISPDVPRGSTAVADRPLRLANGQHRLARGAQLTLLSPLSAAFGAGAAKAERE
jgi:hypothetical protein